MTEQGQQQRRWLAINAGSSSLKLAVFDAGGNRCHSGAAEELDDHDAPPGRAHARALDELITALPASESGPFEAIAHRVVHGGTHFDAPTRIDDSVVATLREIEPLAPLHNPLATTCIERARERFPGTPQFALFDTAFHHGLPPEARDYALPAWCRTELGIRRYGFHGLSVANALRRLAEATGHPPERLDLIVMHLGNGASVTAVRGGQSMNTSMGMTPLEGLVMGSRAGDLDPAIPGMLERRGGLSSEQVDHLLNHESGLLGLCGTRDMRAIHAAIEQGRDEASAALAMYIHRIRHYLGGYLVNLGRLDALVFTGGIGEHDPRVRESVCAGLGAMGLALDPDANRGDDTGVRPVHQPHSPAGIWVVPADEEREMVRQIQEIG